MEKTNLDTAIFYTCGVCNLQCRYCGIDKNPILKKIDDALGESFGDGEYYFEQVKKYFPNKGQFKRIETWGGEPFIAMNRIYPLLHKIINYYPYFYEMFSSTNFSYPQWSDQVLGLLNQFRQYPERDFQYTLQLSIDGPEYINDAGRGKGVTKRCLENYRLLLQRIKNGELPENVELAMTLKATLDNDSLHKLNDKQKLIEYYQFFEQEFWEPFKEIKDDFPNVILILAHPNTAVPSPVTVDDGKEFAEICRKCREIEAENQFAHYFETYDTICFFDNDITQNQLTYKYSHHTCGTGTSMIGFLPNNMLSTCHEGFTHFAMEYKRQAALSDRVHTATITFDKFLSEQSVPYCVDEQGYEQHMRKMEMYNNPGTSARLINLTAQIISLAMAGQVESCYLNQENALKAAIFLQGHTSFCIKDNYNKTGSFTLVPHGTIKLLLNGALQYIQHDGELTIDEGGLCNEQLCSTCYGCR